MGSTESFFSLALTGESVSYKVIFLLSFEFNWLLADTRFVKVACLSVPYMFLLGLKLSMVVLFLADGGFPPEL